MPASYAAPAARSLTWALCAATIALSGCDKPEDSASESPIVVRTLRPSRGRMRVAAISLRFAHSGVEPGSVAAGYDRLQVSGVFADCDRRDVQLVADLVGNHPHRRELPELDTCVRQSGPMDPSARKAAVPQAHVQLLDVGNVQLKAGGRVVPLRIELVPSLFSAVRGVRYDAEVDRSRGLLAAGSLSLEATGGDGIAAFKASIQVPRPVRITHIGGQPVRGGHVTLVNEPGPLTLRWGSVDGTADLEVTVGAERGQGLDWVRCRLTDDGAFALPSAVLHDLPKRTVRRPWLVSVVRKRAAAIPGFAGTPLMLELVDSVRVR